MTFPSPTVTAVDEEPARERHESLGPRLPRYMTEVYGWAYVRRGNVRLLDRNLVVKTLLFGNDQRLMRAYLQRIRPGMRVWQLAHVYGDLVQRAAWLCGPTGHFTLTDITPAQLTQADAKLVGMPWARTHQADAAQFTLPQACDLICSFFLLHEVPDDWKRRVVDNVLRQLQDGAEAVFVDYHRPAWWHPLRYLLKWVNRWLEPFAESLWWNEIRDFASGPDAFVWEKRTVFGGVYQVVVVRRR